MATKNKKTVSPQPMHYFAAIAHEVKRIDELANEYLAKFTDELSCADMADRIHAIAWDKFEKAGRSFDAVDEDVALVIDDGVPFCGPQRLGSLYNSLGFSLASQEAHLRNLLERMEGRETKELDFPVIADKKNVNRLSGLGPEHF